MSRAAALLAAATLALGGCNDRGSSGAETQIEIPPANQAAPAPQPIEARARLDPSDSESGNASAEAAPDPAAVTRSWFVGRWTDSGNCADAGAFDANGTYRLPDGTRGMWSVVDNLLVIQNAAGRVEARLKKLDEDNVEVANPNGATGRSVRCR